MHVVYVVYRLERMAPSPILNLGLPRTGTTSFSCACALLGLRTVHNAQLGVGNRTVGLPIPVRGAAERNATILLNWMEELLDERHARHAHHRRLLEAYDSWSDNPLYGSGDPHRSLRRRLARILPDARFVCTIRPFDDWLHSMTHTHQYAGGAFLAHLAGTRTPFIEARDARALRAFYDKHYAEECHGVPLFNASELSPLAWVSLATVLDGVDGGVTTATTDQDARMRAAKREALRLARTNADWPRREHVAKLRPTQPHNALGDACPF